MGRHVTYHRVANINKNLRDYFGEEIKFNFEDSDSLCRVSSKGLRVTSEGNWEGKLCLCVLIFSFSSPPITLLQLALKYCLSIQQK